MKLILCALSGLAACAAWTLSDAALPGSYCIADPTTHIPYELRIVFAPGSFLTGKPEGGDSNTPGSQFLWKWSAPGPVWAVEPIDRVGPWERINYCQAEIPDSNVATCEGWINGGNAGMSVVVRWEQVCTVQELHTELSKAKSLALKNIKTEKMN